MERRTGQWNGGGAVSLTQRTQDGGGWTQRLRERFSYLYHGMPRAACDNEIAQRKQLHRTAPNADFLEGIDPDQEIKPVGLPERVLQPADALDGIVWLAALRFEQGRHKARLVRCGQCQHGKAVVKVCYLLLLLVRRHLSGNEVYAAQIEALSRGARHSEMAPVHRIQRSTH